MSSTYYCTEAKLERTTFGWTIKNFSLLLEDKGTPICSPFFYSESKKEKWQIQFYPRGHKDSSADYSSLYLHLKSCELPANRIQYELSIIQSGIVVHKRESINTYESLSSWGFKNFIARSRLLSHATDTFTISCKIDKPLESILSSLADPPMAITQELSIDKKTGRLTEDFAGILENSKFCDVTIIVEDQKFRAHKLILATRSPVFAAMFENKEMDENKKNEVKIEKMEPSVAKGMLEFIYTDKVSNFDEISNGLLLAADKYDLVRLRALCEESLAKTLSNETAAEILVLADLHRCDNLKKHVMQFMENHLADIINSEGYREIEKKYPELLLEFIRFTVLQKETKKF